MTIWTVLFCRSKTMKKQDAEIFYVCPMSVTRQWKFVFFVRKLWIHHDMISCCYVNDRKTRHSEICKYSCHFMFPIQSQWCSGSAPVNQFMPIASRNQQFEFHLSSKNPPFFLFKCWVALQTVPLNRHSKILHFYIFNVSIKGWQWHQVSYRYCASFIQKAANCPPLGLNKF